MTLFYFKLNKIIFLNNLSCQKSQLKKSYSTIEINKNFSTEQNQNLRLISTIKINLTGVMTPENNILYDSMFKKKKKSAEMRRKSDTDIRQKLSPIAKIHFIGVRV